VKYGSIQSGIPYAQFIFRTNPTISGVLKMSTEKSMGQMNVWNIKQMCGFTALFLGYFYSNLGITGMKYCKNNTINR
jgi:hypothetical protein